MADVQTLILAPPQGCGVVHEETGAICGAPATLAFAEPAPQGPDAPSGYLLVLPICEACARAAPPIVAAVLAEGDFVLVSHHMRLPPSPTPGVLRQAANLLDTQAAHMQRDAGVLRERADELARRN